MEKKNVLEGVPESDLKGMIGGLAVLMQEYTEAETKRLGRIERTLINIEKMLKKQGEK